MKKTLILSILLNFALFIAFGIWWWQKNKTQYTPIDPKTLNYDTEIHKAIQYLNSKGKRTRYYYFNLWAVFCKPCIAEMPRLDSLAAHASPDITWTYVTHNSNQMISEFFGKSDRYKPQKFELMNEQEVLMQAIFKELHITGGSYPTHLIVDSTGKILHSHSGYIETPVGDILLNQAIARLKP